MRYFLVLALVSLFFVAPIYTPAQKPFRTSAPEIATVEYPESDDPVVNFPKKGLPEIAILGQSPSPELAARVARDISKYDDDSLPLLMAAIQKAGFYIIDKDQRTLYRPISGDGMGMAFYDFEIVGMLKGSGLGASTTVAELTSLAASGDREMLGDGRGDLMLQDLRNALSSDDQQLRYLAHLIVEFGKQFPVPVDITKTDPANAVINIIQASLLERLLLRDFIYLYQANFPDGISAFPVQNLLMSDRGFRIINAAWIGRDDDPCEFMSDIGTLQKIEKTGKKTSETIKIFKEMMKSIDNTPANIPKPKNPSILTKTQGFFKSYSKGIGIANAALSWFKLVMAWSNVKADIKTEDPMPLIRTKSDRNSGEVRTVTAKFTMEMENSELLNCAGKAISLTTGVSFSVPKGGPMTDKPVSWEVVMTGDRYNKYANTPVWVDALTKSDISKQFTNADGESKIKLTGKPQPKDLEKEPVVPLAKKADLRVSIALEKMKFKEDVPKVVQLGLGAEIDPVSIIGFIPEMLGKVQLNKYKVQVPIRDWQPCSEDWGGVIEFKRELSKSIIVKSSRTSNGNSTGDGARTIKLRDEASITLNPRAPDEIKTRDPKPADLYVRGSYSDITEGKREADPCCGLVGGDFDTYFRSGETRRYSDFLQRRVQVSYRGSERDYGLEFSFYADGLTLNRKEFYEILNSTCPIEYANSRHDESEMPHALTGALPDGRYGERFVNSAGELLSGKKELTEPDGAKVTWTWELARCKSQ